MSLDPVDKDYLIGIIESHPSDAVRIRYLQKLDYCDCPDHLTEPDEVRLWARQFNELRGFLAGMIRDASLLGRMLEDLCR